jgi:hypothetical protein
MTDIGNPTLPLQTQIPSYPYIQFQDDLNIDAFFDSYNSISSGYLAWSNSTPLSVWSSANISGPLLDWIGQGIYGISRPVFSSLVRRFRAGLNSRPLNTQALNSGKLFQSGSATPATDDYYRRVLTWWLYVGNGRNFNVEVLRLKVARFIYGVNGTDVTLAQAQTIHIEPQGVLSPMSPVLSSVAGGALSAHRYGVQATYTNSLGETLAGPTAALSVASSHLLVVASPSPMNGATGWYPYVNILNALTAHKNGLNSRPLNTRALNSGGTLPVSAPTRQVTTGPIAIGTNWTEPTSGLIAGVALPTTNTSNAPPNIIITVPAAAGQASQLFAQAMSQNLLAFPFWATATVVIA